MKSTIKNIYTFFVFALCLNASIHASEWDIPISGTQEITTSSSSLTNFISETMNNNPILSVAVPVSMVVGAGLFAVRGKIYSFFEKKHQDGLDTLQKKMQAQQDVFANTKFVTIMSFLGPIRSGFSNYFVYNKFHIVAAAILSYIGNFFGHTFLGAGSGGFILATGYFSQGFKQFQAENKAMHEETQKKIGKVKVKVESLSKQLTETDKGIKTELSNVQTIVIDKIDGVDQRITGLSEQLKDVPNQILDLIAKVDELGNSEEARVVAVRELITKVQNQYIAVQNGFSKMEQQVIAKLTTIEATLNTQNDKLNSQDQKIDSIIRTTTETGQLVTHLQAKQQEDHKKLLDSITANNSNSEQKLAFLGQLIESWEKRAVDFTNVVKNYKLEQTENVKKIDDLLCRMHTIDVSITSVNSKVDSQALELAAMKQLVVTSNKKSEELANELKDLREEIKKRDKNFFDRLAETAGDIKNQLGGKMDRLTTQVTRIGAAMTGGYLSPISVPITTIEQKSEDYPLQILQLHLTNPKKQRRILQNEVNS